MTAQEPPDPAPRRANPKDLPAPWARIEAYRCSACGLLRAVEVRRGLLGRLPGPIRCFEPACFGLSDVRKDLAPGLIAVLIPTEWEAVSLAGNKAEVDVYLNHLRDVVARPSKLDDEVKERYIRSVGRAVMSGHQLVLINVNEAGSPARRYHA